MPLVAAKCTDCGGATTVDNEKKAAVCQSCGNAFIVQEAINHFHTHNTTNIKDSVVHIHEDKNKGFYIEVGVLKKYNGAEVDVVIPDSVIAIGDKVFESLPITSVTMPNSVTSIGRYAFDKCSSLASVTMSNSLASIGEFAFQECTNLESIVIPNSVTRIDKYAFGGCSKLINVKMPPLPMTKDIDEMWLRFDSTPFLDSPYYKELEREYWANYNKELERKNQEQDRERWVRNGRCPHCGGKMGFFGKCKSCGK